MPKPRDLAADRRLRARAAFKRRVHALTYQGYSPADAERVVAMLDSLVLTMTIVKLNGQLGGPIPLGQLEQTTLVEIRDVMKIIEQHEPEKAAQVAQLIQKYEAKHVQS